MKISSLVVFPPHQIAIRHSISSLVRTTASACLNKKQEQKQEQEHNDATDSQKDILSADFLRSSSRKTSTTQQVHQEGSDRGLQPLALGVLWRLRGVDQVP
jgi:hypothetical protein